MSSKDPLIGTQLGHFRVEQLIAEGGMGLIYKATHTVIGRRAAIKVLSEKYSNDQNMIKRLHREARAVNKVGHPNIIDIFDFGRTEDNREYFVMEYLPGKSLAELQQQMTRIPWSLGGPVLAQTLDALAAAHDRNIVHRDIKPENILVVPQQDGGVLVKVLDFGIAKSIGLGPEGERLTRAGSVMGTPEYISPEQIRGREVDGRSDLYAVGAILFEMCMGRRPFEADKVITLLMMHLRDPVPSMEDIPAELGVPRFVPSIVNKAMAKEPDQRFPDARTFARALGLETSAVAPSDGTRPLPQAFWVKDDPATTAPTVEDGSAVQASLQAAFATQSSPSVARAPSLQGATGAPSLRAELAAMGESRRPSALRWAIPVGAMLLASAAIVFYVAFHFAGKPRGGTSTGSAATATGGSGATRGPAKDRAVDLPSLAQAVRLVLRSGVSQTDPDVRRLAFQGLGEIRDADAVRLMKAAMNSDPERSVRAAAALALAALGDADAVAALRDTRTSADETMKVWIDDALMRLGQTDGIIGLREALKSKDKAVRFQAALALADTGNKAALEVLEDAARAPDVNKQAAVALLSALARLGHEESFKSLQKALDASDPVLELGAAEALLRMGQDAATSRLRELLGSDKPVIKLVAAKLLATAGDFSGLAALREAIRSKDEALRHLAADGLGAISDKAALPPLAGALEDPVWAVKAAAAESLARILSLMPTAMVQRGQDWLMAALANRDWSVRHAAVGATAEMDPELAVNLLGWAYKDKDPRVRLAAVARLEDMHTRQAVPLLASALGDEAEEVRGRAAMALGRISDPAAKQALQAAVRDKSHAVRALAAGSLLAQGDTSYLQDLLGATRSPQPALRRAAITALGKWPDPEAETRLKAALEDKDSSVRFAAAHALAMRGKRDGIDELKKALGKGGDREPQAAAALTSLGMKPFDLGALAKSGSAESRRAAVENASALEGEAALQILRRAAQDRDPGVRAAAASGLGKLAARDPRAVGGLRSLAKDADPAVRIRAQLALARVTRTETVLDMGKVRPVKPASLPAPPSPPPKLPEKKDTAPKPLFVDEKSPQQLFMQYSARATVAAARGDYQAALGHLHAAQKYRDAPPLYFELGMVHLRMSLQPGRNAEWVNSHLRAAKMNFETYLRRAPGGQLAGKARKGLKDVERLSKLKPKKE